MSSPDFEMADKFKNATEFGFGLTGLFCVLGAIMFLAGIPEGGLTLATVAAGTALLSLGL